MQYPVLYILYIYIYILDTISEGKRGKQNPKKTQPKSVKTNHTYLKIQKNKMTIIQAIM